METFQLPNEVSCTTKTSLSNESKNTIHEYKKETTLSSISRPNRIKPTNTKHLTFDEVEAKLAKQATALQKLKWISGSLAFLTVVNAAIFGGLTHSLMKRMGDNERISTKLNSEISTLLSIPKSNTTLDYQHYTGMETRLLQLELNQSHYFADTDKRFDDLQSILDQYRNDTDARILNLELNQIKYHNEVQDIARRIDFIESNVTKNKADSQKNLHRLKLIENVTVELETETRLKLSEMNAWIGKLETDIDAHKTAMEDDSNRLTNIEAYLETEKEIVSNLSITVNELITDFNTGFVTDEKYTNETRKIWENIETQDATNEEHNTLLLQLKTDLDSVKDEIKNHFLRIVQVESNQTVDTNTTELLSTRVAQLEADLASERIITEAHNETILDNSESLAQLKTDIIVQNASIKFVTDLLAQVEEDMNETQTNISLHETAILQANAILDAQNALIQSHASRIEILESQGISNKDIIANHNVTIKMYEADLRNAIANIETINSINHQQTARILELDSEANKTRQKLDDHDAILRSDTGKVAFCARLDTSLTNVGIGDVIKFDSVLLNEGSGYDASTGQFTAPVTGVYQFSYFVGHNLDPPSQTWAQLMANGTKVNAAVVDAMHNSQDIQGGNIGVVRLGAGEKAWIESYRINNAVFNAGHGFSTFSGVFVYK